MRSRNRSLPLRLSDDFSRWKDILKYWRRFPADFFDEAMQTEVVEALQNVTSTSTEWSNALQGDAAITAGLVLRLKLPCRIGVRTDIAMTVLLRAAFKDAGAAAVLSHMLQRMPIHKTDRTNLSTSWQVYKIWLKCRCRTAQ